jgi:hypothetical protein
MAQIRTHTHTHTYIARAQFTRATVARLRPSRYRGSPLIKHVIPLEAGDFPRGEGDVFPYTVDRQEGERRSAGLYREDVAGRVCAGLPGLRPFRDYTGGPSCRHLPHRRPHHPPSPIRRPAAQLAGPTVLLIPLRRYVRACSGRLCGWHFIYAVATVSPRGVMR